MPIIFVSFTILFILALLNLSEIMKTANCLVEQFDQKLTKRIKINIKEEQPLTK